MTPRIEVREGDQVTGMRRGLLAWFHENKRDLPWRRNRSVYAVVVSEFMLQQTQVSTVLPYFERWMERFPDFEGLAAAEEDDVLSLWQGLGYYSRARNLRKLAQAVVAEGVPEGVEGWLTLPGVGPYTAAAIASIAQNLPAAVVDGNVVRVLARLSGEDRTFTSGSAAVSAFTEAAQEFLNREHPAAHNEAMMELGATVCLPKTPRCLFCPLSDGCKARRMGIQDELPRIVRVRAEKVTVQRLWAIRDGRMLLSRIQQNSKRLAGFLELPSLKEMELGASELDLVAVKRRAISNQQIREEIYSCQDYPMAKAENLEWVPVADLEKINLSGPHRRWINELLTQHPPQ